MLEDLQHENKNEKEELLRTCCTNELEFFNRKMSEECILSVYYQSNLLWNAYQNNNCNTFDITFETIHSIMNDETTSSPVETVLLNPIIYIDTSSNIIESQNITNHNIETNIETNIKTNIETNIENPIISFKKESVISKKRLQKKQKYSKTILKSIVKEAKKRYLFGNIYYSNSLSLSEIYLQLDTLRNSPQPEQRTQEWYDMRTSMLTASDFYKALGSTVSIDNYAISKVLPRESKSSYSHACQHGILFEPVCKLFYESMFPAEIDEFGLLQHSKYSFIGASPDGICNEKSGKSFVGRLVEFKAPYSRKIIKGHVPESYLIQMQGQLEVTGLSTCDYLECDFELFDINPDETDDINYIAKGIIVKYWKDSKECYHYGNINCTIVPTNYSKPYKVLYWVLKDFNIVTVQRNSYWFTEYLLPALTFTWNRTLWFRQNPKELTCKLQKKNQKNKKYLQSENKVQNMFL
jgi:putative phage-type endonuclease